MAFAVNYICMLKTNTILPWKKTEVLKFSQSPHIPNSQKYTKALPNGQMVFAVCYLCKGSWTWITVLIPLVLAMPGSHPIGIFIGFPISLPFCLRLGSHLCPRWIILLCLFHIYDVINSITCTREPFQGWYFRLYIYITILNKVYRCY